MPSCTTWSSADCSGCSGCAADGDSWTWRPAPRRRPPAAAPPRWGPGPAAARPPRHTAPSRSGSLAVVEVRPELADLQELLGRLDEKARPAGTIARQRGWRAVRILTVLAVAATAGDRAAGRG